MAFDKKTEARIAKDMQEANERLAKMSDEERSHVQKVSRRFANKVASSLDLSKNKS
jgi:FixJ family two-component response regulator